jgi:hypothetical protein
MHPSNLRDARRLAEVAAGLRLWDGSARTLDRKFALAREQPSACAAEVYPDKHATGHQKRGTMRMKSAGFLVILTLFSRINPLIFKIFSLFISRSELRVKSLRRSCFLLGIPLFGLQSDAFRCKTPC